MIDRGRKNFRMTRGLVSNSLALVSVACQRGRGLELALEVRHGGLPMLTASDRTHQLLSFKQSDPHLVALSHALPSKSTKARHSGCRTREKATSDTREEAFERCLHTLLFTFLRSRLTSTSTKLLTSTYK